MKIGKPAAKQGDRIVAVDTHIVLIQTPAGAIPTTLPHPFNGVLNQSLSFDVKIMGKPAATVNSSALNTPMHIPQGGLFQKFPSNQGKVIMGSSTVRINGKMAARNGDLAMTCNDPTDLPVGQVIAVGTVLIGG